MEGIIQYFESIPSAHRSAILVGGISFFWILESAFPLFKFKYAKWKHAWINIFFTLTTIIVNFLLAFLLVLTSRWVATNEFGLLRWFSKMPLWLEIISGLFFLDLVGAWLAHWVQHKIKPLWMLHLIHHTDTHVDTTTANRHHPGESAIRFMFTLLAVFFGGISIGIVLLYQSLSVVFSQFNHANIKLPVKLDKTLSWFIVSPDMHKIHHHYVMPYTDSNYGNIFSFWDRFFGTFKYLSRTEIIYGIDTVPDPRENAHVIPLLKLPFKKYRPPKNAKFKN